MTAIIRFAARLRPHIIRWRLARVLLWAGYHLTAAAADMASWHRAPRLARAVVTLVCITAARHAFTAAQRLGG